MIEVVETARDFAGAVWHAGNGVAYLLARWGQDGGALIDVARQAAEWVGGHVTLERASIEMKQTKGVWGREVAGLEIMRGLKRVCDPDGVLWDRGLAG
jgi:FAD/FMN-containing dehydrogenase